MKTNVLPVALTSLLMASAWAAPAVGQRPPKAKSELVPPHSPPAPVRAVPAPAVPAPLAPGPATPGVAVRRDTSGDRTFLVGLGGRGVLSPLGSGTYGIDLGIGGDDRTGQGATVELDIQLAPGCNLLCVGLGSLGLEQVMLRRADLALPASRFGAYYGLGQGVGFLTAQSLYRRSDFGYGDPNEDRMSRPRPCATMRNALSGAR